ncbi:MAG: glycosyltransferase, partial [Planctomycetota bacterium]
MSRHAVLVTFGSHGDLHPFLGLGSELLRRGFRVTVIANAKYEDEIASHGLGFVAVGSVDDFDRFTQNPDMWHSKRAIKVIFGALAELAPATHERLTELVPDFVIASTLAAGARVYRETHPDTPLLTVHLQPTAMRSNIDPPRLPGLPPLDRLPGWIKAKVLPHFWNGADRYVLDPLVKDLAAFRESLGLEPTTSYLGTWQHSPDRILAMWPDWYAPPPVDWPEATRLVGCPLYDERDTQQLPADLAAFLDEGDPPIAFTPGSAMFFGEAFFKAAVEA